MTHLLNEQQSNIVMKTMGIGFLAEWSQLLYDLRWMIILGVILILTDLWFGLSESRYLHKGIRKSSAGRRTLNKAIDYTCYVLVGATIGKAIAEPYGIDPTVTAVTAMVLCYGFEIDSIYNHICILHDVEPKYSVWGFIGLLITFRWVKFGEVFSDMTTKIQTNKKAKRLKKKNHE